MDGTDMTIYLINDVLSCAIGMLQVIYFHSNTFITIQY